MKAAREAARAFIEDGSAMTGPTCLEGGTRHAWENCGLDVVKNKLVSVRRCVWCHVERTSTPKPHPHRRYNP